MIKVVKNGIVLPFIIILASVALILGAFFLLDKRPKTVGQNAVQAVLPSATPSPEIDIPNWKTYINDKLGFEFKYPEFYKSIKETEVSVSLGVPAVNGNIFYLTFSNDTTQLTDYKSYKPCSYNNEPKYSETPCLGKGDHWGQKEDVKDTELGGVDAKSFYITEGYPDVTYHVIETTRHPFIEGKMLVSGGGLDKSFIQILSTFKFMDQPDEEKFCGGIAGIICPSDYKCSLDGNYPDAGGKCVKK